MPLHIRTPNRIDASWMVQWLPVIAIVWTGAFLRAAIALFYGETFSFGSALAAVVVVLVPLVARRTLATLWHLRDR